MPNELPEAIEAQLRIIAETTSSQRVSDMRATITASLEAADELVNEYVRLQGVMGSLLTRTADALKGAPAPLHCHSWHDLPELALAAQKVWSELSVLTSCTSPDGYAELGQVALWRQLLDEQHAEYCDVLDRQIRGKPCNCGARRG